MRILTASWLKEILEHKSQISWSLCFLMIAIIINAISGIYVDKTITATVPDIILDNIPTIDLDFLYIYGISAVVITFFVYPLFFQVDKVHIAISQFSLLSLIRSFFTSLTHLSIPAGSFSFDPPTFFAIFDFQNALFFSGHTAFPFLGYLLFRKEKIGIFFLVATVVMALTVLFMHFHYSIDVFAALFITYGSFKIGERFFKKLSN
jgi:hypothetical protein